MRPIYSSSNSYFMQDGLYRYRDPLYKVCCEKRFEKI